jgi:hypothetical protein
MGNDREGDALFIQYAEHIRAEARAAQIARSARLRSPDSPREVAFKSSLAARTAGGDNSEAAREVERLLREHWRANGGDPAELERRLRETAYREEILALYVVPVQPPSTKPYDDAVLTQKSLQADLRTFWIAGGHDLAELKKFLSSVDEEVVSLIVA